MIQEEPSFRCSHRISIDHGHFTCERAQANKVYTGDVPSSRCGLPKSFFDRRFELMSEV